MMRNKIFFTGVLLAGLLNAQDYTIAKWFNDYEAAMVQTYDDMNADHVNICLPQLKARGMGGTMFVDYDQTSHINLAGGWQGLMNAADEGMEMANHTQTHASCDALDQAGLEREITTFRDFLNSNITNQDCNTFAYPYGAGNQSIMVTNEIAKNHIAARCAGLPGIGPWGYRQNWIYDFGSNESDYFQIPTIAEHFFKPNIQAEVDNLLQYGGLMTTMWHAVTASDHEQYLDNVLAACNGRVWHPNFQDAIKYHKERRVAVLNTLYESGSAWVLSLSDTLNDNIFNHPLTVHLKFGDVIITDIKQNEQSLDYEVVNNEVIFNAVPDGGEIVIEKQLSVSTEQLVFERSLSVYPNPVNSIATISKGDVGDLNVAVFDAYGRLLSEFTMVESIFNVNMDEFSVGTYFLKISSEEYATCKRIVKK